MTQQELKNSILQEAIEGRLVPQDPNDEPASVLLDKIRKEKARLVKEKKIKKSALKEEPLSDEDKLFPIPSTWEWCKLGWIGDWGAGATPAKGNPEFYTNGTIPWLRTGELNNGVVYDSELKVTPYALQKCSLRECKIGDVLIAMYGATIGKVAIAGIELTTNQACCACTPYQVYNKFLLYYLMASKQRFIDLGEGGAQPNISREKIVAFPFPLPPLPEQKRIVAKIEELLPKVEEYGKAQESLDKLNEELPERLKKSILQEAIEGRLVPQDPNDEPASVLLDKIRVEKKRLVKEGKLKKKNLEETPISEDEIPFKIPESWEWVYLFDCIDITYGYPFDSTKFNDIGEGFPLIRIRDILPSSTNTYTIEKADERYVIKKDDMLVGMDGNFNVCFWQSADAYLNQRVCKIQAKESIINQKYLYYYLPYELEEIFKTVSYVTVKHLSDKHFRKMHIPLPPLAEQKRIVEKIEQLLGEIDKLKI